MESSRLAQVDLFQSLGKKEYNKRLKAAQERLLQLRLVFAGVFGDEEPGPPVCVVFEGWDSAGKGGAIRRLVAPLDPRHIRVVQYAAPTPYELRHHWLSRFWEPLPGLGEMSILDRSWYGRVLVERVEGFATEEEWRRAYDVIRGFEESLVNDGMVLQKFWLHISDEEQLARFHRRRDNPLKEWKLTEEDWRNRSRRADYEEAIEDMLDETDRPGAPWSIVAANSKRFARVFVIEAVVARMESTLREADRSVPSPLSHSGR